MREIALHLLDLAENSVSAGAKNITIAICEDQRADKLTTSIADDGRGMDAETVKKVIDPFYTSRTTRKVGLGIPLFKGAAEDCNGTLTIASTPGLGTTVTATFQHSHIDRMPLGNLPETFLGLTVGSVQHDMKNEDRREMYKRDITYITNNEVGFDYLRDNMVMEPGERVMGER